MELMFVEAAAVICSSTLQFAAHGMEAVFQEDDTFLKIYLDEDDFAYKARLSFTSPPSMERLVKIMRKAGIIIHDANIDPSIFIQIYVLDSCILYSKHFVGRPDEINEEIGNYKEFENCIHQDAELIFRNTIVEESEVEE